MTVAYVGGDGCSFSPVECLTGGSVTIFDLIDDDSFGTNPEDYLSL